MTFISSLIPAGARRSLAIAGAACITLAACAGAGQKPSGDDPLLLASRWELTSWTGHQLPQATNGKPVILNFVREKERGRVSGRAGCNQFAAPYSVRAPGQLTITEAVTTRMACPQQAQQFEADFLEQLMAVNHYRIAGSQLEMQAIDGQTLVFQARDKPSADAKIKFIYVAPQKAPCSAGVMQTTCFQIRERKEDPWQLWYGDINGFAFTPGHDYRLRILEEQIANPPADASSVKWTLDLVVEQGIAAPSK
ncbi:DUF4377 domain-containing protein [Paraherbaspirillum soli]|uniref:DUF4377 domain-containing protein n=1 Tax=Paraherbaspirillum soli TaxID=631222 RepID=A0ABW0M5T9_9BURK